MSLAPEKLLNGYQTGLTHDLPVLVRDRLSSPARALDARNPHNENGQDDKACLVLDTKPPSFQTYESNLFLKCFLVH